MLLVLYGAIIGRQLFLLCKKIFSILLIVREYRVGLEQSVDWGWNKVKTRTGTKYRLGLEQIMTGDGKRPYLEGSSGSSSTGEVDLEQIILFVEIISSL